MDYALRATFDMLMFKLNSNNEDYYNDMMACYR